MTTYQLDTDLQANQYQKTGGSESDYVQLPFNVPIIYWKHGDPETVPDEDGKYPIQHFGRWNSGIDEFEGFAEALDLATPKDVERRPRKDRNGNIVQGEFYEVCAWRYLLFSVIAQRSRWFPTRSGKNMSHVQVLAHLAERKTVKKETIIVPTMPALLSAKVYASTKLEELIRQWFRTIDEVGPIIANAITKTEDRIPAHYFYMAIGTFGESKFEGPHGTSTLPQLFIPENLAADSLPFVGNDIARKMSEIKINSQDWLTDEAWLRPEKRDTEQQPQQYQPPEAEYQPDEEIPF